MPQPLSGRTALVTGASSGLGAHFARHLAARGAGLVLVARREERLRDVSGAIEREHDVAVTVVPMDLAEPDAPQRLYDEARRRGLAVDVLVNNAGLGVYGAFLEVPWEEAAETLRVNVVALTHLSRLFTRDMVARGYGYVLQVASIAAYQPSPTYAVYAASKAYVRSFGEALGNELRGTGVSCTVVSPGVTATEFLEVSGQAPSLYQRLAMMQPEEVTRVAVEAMLARRTSVVPGLINKLTTQGTRLVPRRFAAAAGRLLLETGQEAEG